MATGLYRNPVYKRNRERLRQRVIKHGLPCTVCNEPIDTNLKAPHPRAFSADHVTELGAGGDIAGPLEPTHYGCNSRRGARFRHAQRRERLKRNTFHEDPPGLIRG